MTITLYTHRRLLLASSPRSPPAPRGCRGRGEAHRGRGDALEMGKLAEKEGCKQASNLSYRSPQVASPW